MSQKATVVSLEHVRVRRAWARRLRELAEEIDDKRVIAAVLQYANEVEWDAPATAFGPPSR